MNRKMFNSSSFVRNVLNATFYNMFLVQIVRKGTSLFLFPCFYFVTFTSLVLDN